MMLSRVADCLYWMGRYAERAEHSARLLQITVNSRLEGAADDGDRVAERAMHALGAAPLLARAAGLEEVFVMTASREIPDSVFSAIAFARENARQVRDQITTEMWERLNRLYFLVRDLGMAKGPGRDAFMGRPHEKLGEIIDGLHAFKGATESTMLHGEGYRFFTLGVLIERAYSIARLLETHLMDPVGSVGEYGWGQCLRMCCALEPFIRVKTARFKRLEVADFLVLDPQFPRSLAFCAIEIAKLVTLIGPQADSAQRADCERLAGRLHSKLAYATLDEVTDKAGLTFTREVALQCMAINKEILSAFIAHDVMSEPNVASAI
jgi:uncharacterized alpha-E superfamily protein